MNLDKAEQVSNGWSNTDHDDGMQSEPLNENKWGTSKTVDYLK